MPTDLKHRISRLEAADELRDHCPRCSDSMAFYTRQHLERVANSVPHGEPPGRCDECGELPPLPTVEMLREAVDAYEKALAAGLIPPGAFDDLDQDPAACRRLIEALDASAALD